MLIFCPDLFFLRNKFNTINQDLNQNRNDLLAKWNDAATAAVNASNNSGPVYGSNTSGTSIGIQLETWF